MLNTEANPVANAIVNSKVNPTATRKRKWIEKQESNCLLGLLNPFTYFSFKMAFLEKH